ncbi:MAG: F0F1 ATP synthase subunit B [Lachnospiraceae bacterium]|nr:F0F1 ATP synthase subunit B [Lachnospiraceae bacterium]MDD7148533.1 F0F1 ATP synthase subunit B [Lachnospiraceae bacterium]MDY4068611.1 F0F1 ATP synthase subunit B [Lachnospiraceae bacterium]
MDSYLFDLKPQLIHDAILSMIAVFTLFLVASNLLFNPVRQMLKKRQDKIQGELEDAKQNQDEAAALKAEYEAKLKDINVEAEEILGEARKKALANENRIIAEAKEEAARIRERAEQEAELEKKKAADDVKKEMISIASVMAGKVVAASIDTTVQDSLIEETLKEIGDNTWLS